MDARLDARYFPLVLDVVDQGIFTVDPAGHISSFNKAAAAITGYTEAEVLGRDCASVFRTDLCNTVCPLRQSIASGMRVRNRRVTIIGKGGQAIPIAVSTAPLESPAGELLGGVEVFSDLSRIEELQRKLDGRYRAGDLITGNPEMRRILDMIPLVAGSTSTILISGPTGVGKELLAKAIHHQGLGPQAPFVAVNCAALPETLLESELFGYRKGAFTDAKTDKAGRIAQAEGGTLFLDEVGDLPLPLQVKLLRFLQEKSYEPLGSTASVRANVRVITATNRDLEQMVRNGSFREDLYFRLNVLQIALPPLRQRREDVPLLAQHFVERYRQTTGKPIGGFSREAMAALTHYEFPGNIRELENVVERAFILCQRPEIGLADLPPAIAAASTAGAGSRGLDSVQMAAIKSILERHGGNRTRAALELGIHRSTLIRKIRLFGL